MLFSNLFKLLLREKERGAPVPWTDLFDRTHRRDKGKGEYTNKKSEAVAVSIRCNPYSIQIGFSITMSKMQMYIGIFNYVDVS